MRNTSPLTWLTGLVRSGPAPPALGPFILPLALSTLATTVFFLSLGLYHVSCSHRVFVHAIPSLRTPTLLLYLNSFQIFKYQCKIFPWKNSHRPP